MGNPRSFAVLLGAWLSCVALFGSSACVTASAQSSFERYEVIPASWLESAGTPVAPVPPPTDVYSAGYVFPSLRPGSSPVPCAAAEGPFECSQNFPSFFGPHSHLAETYIYKWTAASGDEIQLTVTRSDVTGTIAIAPASLSALMRLDWAGFTQLLSNFRRALCRKNAFIGLNCTHTFVALDADLSQFWSAVAYQRAHFADFAAKNLNGATKDDFDVHFTFDTVPGSMHATPVHVGQALNIVWGSTSLYPDRNRTLASGYSRPTVGGATQLRVSDDAGLKVFPSNKWTSVPVGEDNSQQTTICSSQNQTPTLPTSVPFPPEWTVLMKPVVAPPQHPPVFLPVFNLLDLRSKWLLHAADAAGSPKYLYLLSPVEYISADAGDVPAEFASDARIVTMVDQSEASPKKAPLSLLRRFLLIGCDQPDDDATHHCVTGELQSLLDQALKKSSPASISTTPAFPDFTIAAFGNQTYLELRNHVNLDGRPALDTYLPGESWNTVFAGWKPSEIGDADPGTDPLLEVRRTQFRRGFPPVHIRLFFHTTSTSVMSAAQVMEGDEFYGHGKL